MVGIVEVLVTVWISMWRENFNPRPGMQLIIVLLSDCELI